MRDILDPDGRPAPLGQRLVQVAKQLPTADAAPSKISTKAHHINTNDTLHPALQEMLCCPTADQQAG